MNPRSKRVIFKLLGVFIFALIGFCFFFADLQANVVLKVVAVNPSKEQTQKAYIKAYLPKEVKPEDVIDKADLDIIYDTQQGSYFVAGEYDLEPGEVKELEIEIKDLWVIPGSDLEELRLEAIRTLKQLENTDFEERAVFLRGSIESKLNDIIKKQKVPATNPEKHISEYRDNLSLLASIKDDLVVARSLLSQAKPVHSMTVWRMFFIIVGFLGILGLSFYIVWQKQLKVINEPTFGGEKHPETVISEGEKREAKKEERAGVEDIERIIREEGK